MNIGLGIWNYINCDLNSWSLLFLSVPIAQKKKKPYFRSLVDIYQKTRSINVLGGVMMGSRGYTASGTNYRSVGRVQEKQDGSAPQGQAWNLKRRRHREGQVTGAVAFRTGALRQGSQGKKDLETSPSYHLHLLEVSSTGYSHWKRRAREPGHKGRWRRMEKQVEDIQHNQPQQITYQVPAFYYTDRVVREMGSGFIQIMTLFFMI